MRTACLALVAAAWLIAGCGNTTTSYDHSTPEATVGSLIAAVNAGRLPKDVRKFFADDFEIDSWSMRCSDGRCASAELKALTVVSKHSYRAEFHATYAIRNPDGGAIMRGKDSPIVLRREGKHWYISQWGRRQSPSLTPAAPPTDASESP